ncbi:hypothetical protein [Dokdonella sp.]|uniref:hypothetical protein n=1 Tax=Dokdonella sp. TaxID=2291710 RepID=UPI0031BC806D|nr:energy transducer TonB [Dokdonella sp.]
MIRHALILLLAAGCVSASATAQTMSGALPTVVPSEKLADWWVMVNDSLQAEVPNFGRNIQTPGCATVSFVIEPDGRTSTIKLQKVAPEGDLGRIAMSVAANLRFAPTAFNAAHQRVFSWLIFPFNLPVEKAAATAVMQQCYVKDLSWKDH